MESDTPSRLWDMESPTHEHFAQLAKLITRQSFRQNACHLVLRRDVFYLDLAALNIGQEMEEEDGEMLGVLAKLRVLGNLDARSIVFKHFATNLEFCKGHWNAARS